MTVSIFTKSSSPPPPHETKSSLRSAVAAAAAVVAVCNTSNGNSRETTASSLSSNSTNTTTADTATAVTAELLPYIFYWSRPIGASDALIRLTIMEQQPRPLRLVSKQKDQQSQKSQDNNCHRKHNHHHHHKPINHHNVNRNNCCWSLPITTISQLVQEIQTTLLGNSNGNSSRNSNSNSNHSPTTTTTRNIITTLEICFHEHRSHVNDTTGTDLDDETDDCHTATLTWDRIAHALQQQQQQCGYGSMGIQTISFIYHYHTNNHTAPIPNFMATATHCLLSPPSQSQQSKSTGVVGFHSTIQSLQLTFITTTAASTATATATSSSKSRHDSHQQHQHSSHIEEENEYATKLWNIVQHYTRLRQLTVTNGISRILQIPSNNNPTIAPLPVFYTIILPRLQILHLYHMSIDRTVYTTALLPGIEQYNVIPNFQNIQLIVEAVVAPTTTAVTTKPSVLLSPPPQQPRSGSNPIYNTTATLAKTVSFSSSSSKMVDDCINNNNNSNNSAIIQSRCIRINSYSSSNHNILEYTRWLQLLHQWRFYHISKRKHSNNAHLSSSSSSSSLYNNHHKLYTRNKSRTSRSTTTTTTTRNINTVPSSIDPHYINYVALMDSVVMIVRNWYKQ